MLTVRVITQSRVKKDAGLLLGLLGHVNSHVQVLDPLPHLHFGAEITNIQTELMHTLRFESFAWFNHSLRSLGKFLSRFKLFYLLLHYYFK